LTAETAVSPTLQLTQDIQPVYVTVWVSDSKPNISSTAGFRLVQLENKLWVNYIMNLYDIIDQLRAKYPNLEIESCFGGGGRIDLGILKRVEQAWTSDNTEAFDRLTIQDGSSTRCWALSSTCTAVAYTCSPCVKSPFHSLPSGSVRL
jgi:alpha-galactosidase